MRKTRNKNKKLKIFLKYDKNKKNYLTKKEIQLCFRKEFKLKYNNHVMNSFLEIWGTRINSKKVITYKTYLELFKNPDGFLRDICL
jgi:hypothetical protein